MRFAITKSGVSAGLVKLEKFDVAISTRAPATLLVTLVVRSRTRMGLRPLASRTFRRDWLTRF